MDAQKISVTTKLLAALLYGTASFIIVLVNKNLLTGHRFPSFQFVGIGQMVATIILLFIGKRLDIITYPDFSQAVVTKVWPLPLIYVANLVFGLGSTKTLSVPMLTVLRRFSIVMTMIGEKLVLGKVSSSSIQLTVFVMIAGALVAASDDMSFSVVGYSFVILNDFFTAANAVLIKQKLAFKDLGKYGLLYYNALLMLLPAILLAWYTGEIRKALEFEGWSNPLFCFQFLLSCVLGFVLLYGIVWCTAVNSALTTTVIGCLKNILVTYIGMFVGGDYKFSYLNFAGLNISIIGSLVYSYIAFTVKEQKPRQTTMFVEDKPNGMSKWDVKNIQNGTSKLNEPSV